MTGYQSKRAMTEMTPWFPPHIKPARIGVYEVNSGYRLPRTLPKYARWDGIEWSNESYYKHDPELHYTSYGAWHDYSWRGFTKEQT